MTTNNSIPKQRFVRYTHLLICLICSGFIINGCQYNNAKTSAIGWLNTTCLDSLAWKEISSIYAIDSIQNPELKLKAKALQNHFTNPKYILYFKQYPEEIIGCDFACVRAVFNKKIASEPLDGLDPKLTDLEQKRIRNRIISVIMRYQCQQGKRASQNAMQEPVL